MNLCDLRRAPGRAPAAGITGLRLDLRELVIDHRTEDDLRWRWRWAEGEMGLRSNFGPMVSRLEAGGRTGGKPILDLADSELDAAERARLIDRGLEALKQAHPDRWLVLLTAFAPFAHGTELARLSSVPGNPLGAVGHYPGVALLTDAARGAHLDSGTSLELDAWLARLCRRLAQKETLQDRTLAAAIRRETEALVSVAVRAYAAARRRRR